MLTTAGLASIKFCTAIKTPSVVVVSAHKANKIAALGAAALAHSASRTPMAHDATPSLRSTSFLRKRFRPNTWKGDWTRDLSRQTKSGRTDPFFEYKSAYPGPGISNRTRIVRCVRSEGSLYRLCDSTCQTERSGTS